MRTPRLLLAASALSSLALGCKDRSGDPPPGNPKGTFYDAAIPEPPPPPGNPKGTLYDAGMPERPPQAADAGEPDAARPRDAGPPRDAAQDAPRDAPQDLRRRPPDARVYANPKGSGYDDGLE